MEIISMKISEFINLEKKENLEKIGYYAVLGFFCLLIFFIVRKQYIEDQEIKLFEGKTEAEIIAFKHRNLAYYYIEYMYKVNGVEYIGTTEVDRFNCYEDGKLGCVGKKFPLSYSTKDPSKSTINLGIYEKHKRTVEF